MGKSGAGISATQMANHAKLREAALSSSSVAQIVVDLTGAMALVNDRAASLFGIAARDQARPLQDLEVSYKPVELRSLIDRAYAERKSVHTKNIEWQDPAGERQDRKST